MSAPIIRTIGTMPVGTAKGDEHWLTIQVDDGQWIVTEFEGWGIVNESRLSGRNATDLVTLICEDFEIVYGPMPSHLN